ncbi:D-tyrosyl-tRNA(Tyr) deacylase [Candidatus Bathyarchaeota archaeon]|nr:D-tyrosyl-tRNA(Tyr) deacylase [Candidatus Bathyarchaeota archaeon]
MILFVASKKDIAAMNIAEKLVKRHGFKKTEETFSGNPVFSKALDNRTVKIVYIDQDSVNTQELSLPSPLSLLVFLSRHKSLSGTPTLSVHTPGNLGNAELGGLPRTVSISPASAMKEALKAMKEAQVEKGLEYEVSYECTHHGPSLNVPTMFVELGSSEKQWQDQVAAEAVAEGALAAAAANTVDHAVLGVGGPHYNMKFTRKALETETAFGHIIPKYAVSKLDTEILTECITKTLEPVKKAVLDWKGITGADKSRLLSLLAEVGLEVEKI